MSRGEPLNDKDRAPWLRRLREEAIRAIYPGAAETTGTGTGAGTGAGLVAACSALKKSYRDVLRGRLCQAPDIPTVDGNVKVLDPDEPLHSIFPTFFVHLTGSHDTLNKRMENRQGHYMKQNMLESQLQALEPPSDEEKSEDVIQVDIDAIPDIEAQVGFALKAIERLAKARPIIGLKTTSVLITPLPA